MRSSLKERKAKEAASSLQHLLHLSAPCTQILEIEDERPLSSWTDESHGK